MRLCEIRQELKTCNINEIARLSGLSRQILYKIRDGANFTTKTFYKISSAMEIVKNGKQKNKGD